MLHTLSGKSFQILGASKSKLWPKCLTDLYNEEWKGGTIESLRFLDFTGSICCCFLNINSVQILVRIPIVTNFIVI